MIHKRLRDYDRLPVLSGRFQTLAGEHGKVGFKYTADDFGCDGSIPANQPVAKGNDPRILSRKRQVSYETNPVVSPIDHEKSERG